jgi:hypothetical protein
MSPDASSLASYAERTTSTQNVLGSASGVSRTRPKKDSGDLQQVLTLIADLKRMLRKNV